MSKTVFEVVAYGSVYETFRANERRAAIGCAKEYPPHAEARVVKHEFSGTYESRTTIWPTIGETYTQ